MNLDDPFTLLGLPRRFELPAAELTSALRRASLSWHPDRFALADEATRAEAEERMAALNAAFETLQDPLARAGLLLGLGAETQTASPLFLMEMMERREDIEAAQAAGKDGRVQELLATLEQDYLDRLQTLGIAAEATATKMKARAATESSANATLGTLYTEATYLRRSREELARQQSRTP